MKKNKLLRIITNIVIPLLLLGVWVLASIFLNNKFSFSVLTYTHPSSSVVSHPVGKLLKGQKIEGQFQARDDYLGLLTLQFKSYVEYDFAGEDLLTFRIKEKGAKDWYFIGSYRSGILQHQLDFPFGFPVISDSNGKTYVFEVESENGNEINAIELESNPQLSTGYQYPKEAIMGSKKRIIGFFIKKIITSFTNINFLLNSLIYLIPFLIYVFGVKKIIRLIKTKNAQKIYLVGITCLILYDMLILRDLNTGLLVILILGWFSVVKLWRLDSSVTFGFAFLSLFIWVVSQLFGITNIQVKLNIWVYVFFAFGLLQSLIEEKGKFKNTIKIRGLVNLFKLK